jgi:hypothetical protein
MIEDGLEAEMAVDDLEYFFLSLSLAKGVASRSLAPDDASWWSTWSRLEDLPDAVDVGDNCWPDPWPPEVLNEAMASKSPSEVKEIDLRLKKYLLLGNWLGRLTFLTLLP